jgi:hypothetical protein
MNLNFEAGDLAPSRSELNLIGKDLAKRIERRVRRRVKNAKFGPEARYGPTYSTRPHYFDITEPTGAESAFRRQGGASQNARYVHLDGGYEEYRRIYRGGQGGSHVNLQLSGEMMRSMQAVWSVSQGRAPTVRVGITFEGRSTAYRRTTPSERAYYQNQQRDFLHLPKRTRERAMIKSAAKTGLPVSPA